MLARERPVSKRAPRWCIPSKVRIRATWTVFFLRVGERYVKPENFEPPCYCRFAVACLQVCSSRRLSCLEGANRGESWTSPIFRFYFWGHYCFRYDIVARNGESRARVDRSTSQPVKSTPSLEDMTSTWQKSCSKKALCPLFQLTRRGSTSSLSIVKLD